MPSVAVKLYSVFFMFLLKHRLQNRIQTPLDDTNPFGVTSQPEESVVIANPSFIDCVTTKDIHIDSFISLSVRIFLPESALTPPDPDSKPQSKSRVTLLTKRQDLDPGFDHIFCRNSLGTHGTVNIVNNKEEIRRNIYGCINDVDNLLKSEGFREGIQTVGLACLVWQE